MDEKSDKKTRKNLKAMKTLTIIFAGITVVAGIVLGGMVLEKLLKGAPGGEVEISQKRVDALKTFLGAQIMSINEAIAKQLGLESSEKVLVSEVVENSPADEGGLIRGDLVVRFDRQEVTDAQQLQNLVAETSPGDVVRMVVKRRGMNKVLYIKMGETTNEEIALIASNTGDDSSSGKGAQARTSQKSSLDTTDRDRTRDPLLNISNKPESEDIWGISISPITPDIEQRYGLADKKGVVVVEAQPNSKGEIAGLEVGDLIKSVNNRETPDLSTFYSAISKTGDVLLDVYSQGEDKYITMEVNPQIPPVATLGIPIVDEKEGRIAVAADGFSLTSQVAPRFGTAAYFLIIEPENPTLIKSIPNIGIQNDYRGFGIQAVQLIMKENVESVITGGIGPQAFDALTLYNIKIFGVQEFGLRVAEAIRLYNQDKLTELLNPTIAGTGYGRGLPVVPASQSIAQITPDFSKTGGEKTSYSFVQGGPPGQIPSSQMMSSQILASQIPISRTGGEKTSYGLVQGSPPGQIPSSQMMSSQIPISQIPISRTGGEKTSYSFVQGGPPSQMPSSQMMSSQIPISQIPISRTGGEKTSYGLVQGSPPGQIPSSQMMSSQIPISQIPISRTGGEMSSYALAQGGPPSQIPYTPIAPQASYEAMSGSVPSNYTLLQGQPQQGMANQAAACVCPNCGYVAPHQIGIPCYTMICPGCGSIMIRADRLISLTGGKPEQIPPVGRPENIAYQMSLSKTGGEKTSYGLVQGGPPSQMPSSQMMSSQIPISQIPISRTGGEMSSYALAQGGPPSQIPSSQMMSSQILASQIPISRTGGEKTSYSFIRNDSEDDEKQKGKDSKDDEDGFKGKPSKIPLMGKREDIETPNVINIWQVGGQVSSSQAQLTAQEPPAFEEQSFINRTASPQSLFPGLALPGDKGSAAHSSPPVNRANFQTQDLSGIVRAGTCYCPYCGITVTRPAGTPCSAMTCPNCGWRLVNTTPGNTASGSSGLGNNPINRNLVLPQQTYTQQQYASTQQQAIPYPNIVYGTGGLSSQNNLVFGSPRPIGPLSPNTAQSYSLPIAPVSPSSSLPSQNVQSLPYGAYGVDPVSSSSRVVEQSAGQVPYSTYGVNETVPLRSPGSYTTTSEKTSALPVSLEVPKVAIAVDGKKITSEVAPFFDNAPYFLILNYGTYEAIANPNAKDKIGSGAQTAQFLVGKGVGVVIANNISLDALQTLRELKVTIYSGVSGQAEQVIDWYQTGRLEENALYNSQEEGNHDSTSSSSRGKGPREDKQKGESATKTVF